MSLPTKSDCIDFLRVSRNAIMEVNANEVTWFINGVMYPEGQAIKVAEYCLITGQALTSTATIDGILNLARRTVMLEHRLTMIEDKPVRKPWWRRG